MNNEKVKTVIYWIATGLTVLNYAFGGVMYMSANEQVAAGMAQLGYPLYFAVMLGVWKFLGAIALAVPKFPLVKEWAYAGMFFNLTSAAISNAVVGNPAGDVIAPLIGLVLVIVSWALRPASRRMIVQTVS
ncbi:DoxX family protein [bacterium]|nr:DoxX family protein [bacterium]